MSDVTLDRILTAPPEEVWRALTEPEKLAQWWGHDGFAMGPLMMLDFAQIGPWAFEMTSPEGRHMKASGQVTHVTPGQSIGFTWAWHDPEDRRGPESHVTITLTASGAHSTHLRLSHVDLRGDEAGAAQNRGWTSVLGRLDRLFQTEGS